MLKFKTKEVLPLLQHALESKQHRKVCGQLEDEPGLWLVHDEGVYLMSNGDPPQPAVEGKTGLLVAYAIGLSPDDDGYWDAARAEVGGDDFAECLPADMFKGLLDEDAAGRFTVEVDSSRIVVTTPRKRKNAP